MEKRNRPTAFIATAPFVNIGRATAELAGIPDYPFASVPHPVGRLPEPELRARAEAALPEVLTLLLTPDGDGH